MIGPEIHKLSVKTDFGLCSDSVWVVLGLLIYSVQTVFEPKWDHVWTVFRLSLDIVKTPDIQWSDCVRT